MLFDQSCFSAKGPLYFPPTLSTFRTSHSNLTSILSYSSLKPSHTMHPPLLFFLLPLLSHITLASPQSPQHPLKPCPLLSRPLQCFTTPPLFQENTDCHTTPQRCGGPGCQKWGPERSPAEDWVCQEQEYFAGCYCKEFDECPLGEGACGPAGGED